MATKSKQFFAFYGVINVKKVCFNLEIISTAACSITVKLKHFL